MEKRYYIFHRNKVVQPSSAQAFTPLGRRDLNKLGLNDSTARHLEVPQQPGTYVLELAASDSLVEGYAGHSLRMLPGLVEESIFSAWAKAAQLLHWYKTHRYCGCCGSKTVVHGSEPARVCPRCSQCFYPAVAPCVIVLIHRENEILLARSPRFPATMYSTIAGFVETGESAEDTLHREIKEEVGVSVTNIRYFRSQPWPFPSQLMLGFFAEYSGGTLQIDGEEIVDAGWFRLDNLPDIPGPGTISGQLIRDYINRRIS